MSNEMVRRMCRAYWAVVRDSNHTDGSYTDRDMKGMRAAIAAMREPTDVQHNAARDWSYKKYGQPIGKDASDACWKTMIDAALNEGEPQ